MANLHRQKSVVGVDAVDKKVVEMEKLVKWIKKTYNLTSIPVRIKNEKRWESMDEIIVRESFDGMAQRINFNDGYGVIIYDWDEISTETEITIKTHYMEYVA